jgi:hypothetical protein
MMQHSGLNSNRWNEEQGSSALPELCTIVKSFHEFKNVLNSGCFPKEGNPLTIECFWFFEDVFLLAEEK